MLWLVGGLAIASLAATNRCLPAAEVDAHFDVSWSADEPCRWDLAVRIIEPAPVPGIGKEPLGEVENRCHDVGSTGAIELSADRRQIRFATREMMKDGSVRFRVRASRRAQIAIDLDPTADAETSSGQQSVVALSDLLGKESAGGSQPVNQSSTIVHWTMRRVPGDQLRIRLPANLCTFAPQSELKLDVEANSSLELASRSLFLLYELYRVADGRVVAEKTQSIEFDRNGNGGPIGLTETAPAQPGVYEIRCSILSEQENLWTRLRRQQPRLEVARQAIVVIPPAGDRDSVPGAWKTIGEIRPSELATWSVSQWLPASTNRLIPGADPIQHLPADEHAGENVSLIGPGESFQATLPVKAEGTPHRATVRFPAGQSLNLRVETSRVDQEEQSVQSFLLVDNKVSRPGRKWSTHSFVYYPRSRDQIRLVNLDSAEAFAFESIVVKAGPDSLARDQSELGSNRIAALSVTGFDWIDSLSRDTDQFDHLVGCGDETVAMYRLWIATMRLRGYAATNGFNAVSVPAICQSRAWFPCRAFDPVRCETPWTQSGLQVFLELMDRSPLRVLINIDASMPLTAVESAIREGSPAATDAMVATGLAAQRAMIYNPLHPTVAAAIGELVAETDRQAQRHDCYHGLVLRIGPANHGSISTEPTNDDAVRQFYQSLASRLAGKPLLIQTSLPRVAPSVPGATSDSSESRWLIVNHHCRHSNGPLSKQIRFAQSMLASEAIPVDQSSVVCLCDHNPISETSVAAIRETTARDVGRILDRYDPAILMIQTSPASGGVDREFARLLRALVALPQKSLRPVPSEDPSTMVAAVRAGAVDDHLWLTIANQAPWRTQVDLDCTSVIQWQQVGNDQAVDEAELRTTGPRTSVTLQGGQTMVLRSAAAAPGAAIKSWTAAAAGGQPVLAAIKSDVSTIVARLGYFADLRVYPVLSNGGFEQRGGVGLRGWLHAQHPPDAVQVDSEESLEGEQSVMLATDNRYSSRTWLVSESFQSPRSGRLAVALACRGELTEPGALHQLRVSIEGIRDGKPLRHSTQFEVPRDGKWQARTVVLQVDGVEPAAVESLRLTIDSLSAGRVWVDDVRLHDTFPLTKERGDLQSQAFLAVQGLQRGNLAPSARLLENHWAQFLLTEGDKYQPQEPIEQTPPVDEPPSVTERIRSWLPRRLRF